MKIIYLILTLIFTFQFSFSQEQSQLRKVDEIGKTNCCDLGVRTDGFFSELLADDKKAKGYAVIYSNNQNLELALSFERLILGHIKYRDYDESRIVFVRKHTKGDFKLEYWIDEKGEDSAFANQNEEKYAWFNFQKTSLFLSSKHFNELCSEFGEKKQYAEILLANPTLKGHIVIFDSSQKGFVKTKTELLTQLSTQYNVSQNQLRTIFIKIEKDSYPYHELWLVPKKKRN